MANIKLTDSERAERDEKRAAEKAAKAEIRAQKKAEREAALLLKREESAVKREEKKAATLEKRALAKAARDEERAAKIPFEVGQAVKVVAGDRQGIQGVVTECRRVRTFVKVEGLDKVAYVFTADCVAL